MTSIKQLILLILTFFAFQAAPSAQSIVKDTIYAKGKIKSIVSKKDGKKFGYSYHYSMYSDTSKIDKRLFYVDDKLNGLALEFNNDGKLSTTSIYRNNDCLFQKRYYSNQETGTNYDSKLRTYIAWKKNNVYRIDYSDFREELIFYSDNNIKSITITDSSQNGIGRKYYEFSEEGVLLIEGTFADSLVTIVDTLEEIDVEFETILQVVSYEEPLKNGVWSYYSPKGILLEKKDYKFYTEKKGRYILLEDGKEVD